MIRIGIIAFSDARSRVHKDLSPIIKNHLTEAKSLVNFLDDVSLIVSDEIVHSNQSAREVAQLMVNENVDGIICLIPVFAFPNFVVNVVQLINRPVLLLTPQNPNYPGLTGLLAIGGALNQINIAHQRIWGDLFDPKVHDEILSFSRVAKAVTGLKGQVYGLIGGRSIGMATGAAPAELWMKIFGVDIDHVDQSEIIRRAQLVDNEEIQKAKDWLIKYIKEIVFDDELFTPDKWDFQIRCYIALKEIIKEYGFDFCGIKCHFDMSEYYCVQCISAALVNDPYDWNGPKQPIPLACEADSDGALTMQILRLITGKPTCLLDLRYFDEKKGVYVMPNCGAAPTWFAAQSEKPEENLQHVSLVPSISKYAGGGAHVQFVFIESDLTFARLTRSNNKYKLNIAYGKSVNFPINEIMSAVPEWPQAFVELDVEPKKLIRTLQANHIHAVAGDFVNELVLFSRFMDIDYELLNENEII